LLIRRELTERAKDFNIILDDVSITELSFGKEYTAAVEAKQVAQQEAQRKIANNLFNACLKNVCSLIQCLILGAAFVVDRAIQEKQQKIVHAEGEAQAAKLISFSYNKTFFDLFFTGSVGFA